MDIVGLTKQFNVTIPQLINSFDTSDIRLIFSTLSSLVKLRLFQNDLKFDAFFE